MISSSRRTYSVLSAVFVLCVVATTATHAAEPSSSKKHRLPPPDLVYVIGFLGFAAFQGPLEHPCWINTHKAMPGYYPAATRPSKRPFLYNIWADMAPGIALAHTNPKAMLYHGTTDASWGPTRHSIRPGSFFATHPFYAANHALVDSFYGHDSVQVNNLKAVATPARDLSVLQYRVPPAPPTRLAYFTAQGLPEFLDGVEQDTSAPHYTEIRTDMQQADKSRNIKASRILNKYWNQLFPTLAIGGLVQRRYVMHPDIALPVPVIVQRRIREQEQKQLWRTDDKAAGATATAAATTATTTITADSVLKDALGAAHMQDFLEPYESVRAANARRQLMYDEVIVFEPPIFSGRRPEYVHAPFSAYADGTLYLRNVKQWMDKCSATPATVAATAPAAARAVAAPPPAAAADEYYPYSLDYSTFFPNMKELANVKRGEMVATLRATSEKQLRQWNKQLVKTGIAAALGDQVTAADEQDIKLLLRLVKASAAGPLTIADTALLRFTAYRLLTRLCPLPKVVDEGPQFRSAITCETVLSNGVMEHQALLHPQPADKRDTLAVETFRF